MIYKIHKPNKLSSICKKWLSRIKIKIKRNSKTQTTRNKIKPQKFEYTVDCALISKHCTITNMTLRWSTMAKTVTVLTESSASSYLRSSSSTKLLSDTLTISWLAKIPLFLLMVKPVQEKPTPCSEISKTKMILASFPEPCNFFLILDNKFSTGTPAAIWFHARCSKFITKKWWIFSSFPNITLQNPNNLNLKKSTIKSWLMDWWKLKSKMNRKFLNLSGLDTETAKSLPLTITMLHLEATQSCLFIEGLRAREFNRNANCVSLTLLAQKKWEKAESKVKLSNKQRKSIFLSLVWATLSTPWPAIHSTSLIETLNWPEFSKIRSQEKQTLPLSQLVPLTKLTTTKRCQQ